jgi:hypothetical protein
MLHSWVYTKPLMLSQKCINIVSSAYIFSISSGLTAAEEVYFLGFLPALKHRSWFWISLVSQRAEQNVFLQRYSLALRITFKFIKVCFRIFIDMIIKCEIFVQCNTKISYYAEHKVNRITTKTNSDMFWNFGIVLWREDNKFRLFRMRMSL